MIPTAATLTAAMTFGVNSARRRRVHRLEAASSPQPDWLLLVPLLLELYVFILGIALILATLFVALRDIGQVWELGRTAALLRVADHLPDRLLARVGAERSRSSFPFTQVLQDIRAIVLYDDSSGMTLTAADAFGAPAAVSIPIAITLVRVRASASPSSGARSRGSRSGRDDVTSADPRSRSSDVSKTFRLPHERPDDAEGVLPASVRSGDLRAAVRAATTSRFSVEPRRVLRDHRPERQRQEHAAEDHRRHLPPGHGAPFASTASSRRSSSSASASTRSSQRATTSGSTARCSGSSRRELKARSTTSSRSRSSSASSTRS